MSHPALFPSIPLSRRESRLSKKSWMEVKTIDDVPRIKGVE